MECTGGEAEYKTPKCCYIICYGDTPSEGRPGSLSACFSVGFWEREVGQGKTRTFVQRQGRMPPYFCNLKAQLFFFLYSHLLLISPDKTIHEKVSDSKQGPHTRQLHCEIRSLMKKEAQLLTNNKQIGIVSRSDHEKGIRVSIGNTQAEQGSELCFMLLRHSHRPNQIKWRAKSHKAIRLSFFLLHAWNYILKLRVIFQSLRRGQALGTSGTPIFSFRNMKSSSKLHSWVSNV